VLSDSVYLPISAPNIACVPLSARATTRAFGNADCSPLFTSGRPKDSAFSGVSATSVHSLSIVTSRRPASHVPGVASVPIGTATRSNSAFIGSGPNRARAWKSGAASGGRSVARDSAARLCLAGDVLSYRPEEALPDVLQEGMKLLSGRATRRGDDPVARAEAAITYLVVGSNSGASRRAQIWTAGLPDHEAAKAMSEVTPWHVYHLLHTRQPLDEATRQNFLEQEGRPCLTVESSTFRSRSSRSSSTTASGPAGSGHNRPRADTRRPNCELIVI